MAPLRCFVAMRFGEQQTDRVFDRLIKPTLIQQNLLPIRIDRVNHNDSIDTRIIHEIEKCDIAVADLTFARPSVYFEAGYAQRQVPVIYTCRKDHFTPSLEDTRENLRVHFDLQMKNIIPWKDEMDLSFGQNLRARIRMVIRPILDKKVRLARENESSLRFSRLPLVYRIHTIHNISHQQLRSAGFSRYRERTYYRLRKASREYKLVSFVAAPTISKTNLQRWFRGVREGLNDFKTHIVERQLGKVKPIHLIAHWIVCALTKTPPSRVHGALEYFAQDQIMPSIYTPQFDMMMLSRVPVNFYLHTIDRIRSEDDFTERLKATLSSI